MQMCIGNKYLLFCTLASWSTCLRLRYMHSILIIPFFMCLLLFLNLKMSLKIKMTSQTTSSLNLKSFGSGRRKEN